MQRHLEVDYVSPNVEKLLGITVEDRFKEDIRILGKIASARF